MSKYAASQLLLAFVLAGLGAVKGFRILVDQIEDSLSHVANLS
jgi:hypothetical protein